MICAFPTTLTYQQGKINLYLKTKLNNVQGVNISTWYVPTLPHWECPGGIHIYMICAYPATLSYQQKQCEYLFKGKCWQCPGGIPIYMIGAFPATLRYQQNKMHIYSKENADNVQVGIHIYMICAVPATLRYWEQKMISVQRQIQLLSRVHTHLCNVRVSCHIVKTSQSYNPICNRHYQIKVLLAS